MDRRRNPRFQVDRRIFVKKKSTQSGPAVSMYNDISLGGLSCRSSIPLVEGSMIELDLNLKMLTGGIVDDAESAATVIGEVVQSRRENGGGRGYYINHIKFIEMCPNASGYLVKTCDILNRRANGENNF